MKILFVSAETAPYSMVGGLSQVTYFLAKALIKLGHEVRIYTPAYGCISKFPKSPKRPNSPEIIWFENQKFFGSRPKIYGYHDDSARFAAFSRGCLNWLLKQMTVDDRKSRAVVEDRGSKIDQPSIINHPQPSSIFHHLSSGPWFPDVIHCHDWHAGRLIHWLKNDPKYASLKHIPVLYTVHNFSYQGNGALALGLLSADLVNTVSPTHAEEVMTKKYANGLLPILKKIKPGLTGILNGLDNEEFNPATDKNIAFNYSASVIASPAMAGRGNLFEIRQKNKSYLQQLFSLPSNPPIPSPLLAFSGRLVPQKGIDLLVKTLPQILKTYSQVQFICLGNGDSAYKIKLLKLAKSFPRQIGLYLKSDFAKPRQIFAGADIMLIPSRFEPCGIIAMEALRYGSVPLVHRTGGLNDIVTDFNPKTKKGNGLSFSAISHPASPPKPSLFSSLTSAIKLYQNKALWNKLVQNCLSGDFSWDHSALEYEKLYQKLAQN